MNRSQEKSQAGDGRSIASTPLGAGATARPRSASEDGNVSETTKSAVVASCPSVVSLISWMVQMLRWSNAEAAFASWRNRCFPSRPALGQAAGA